MLEDAHSKMKSNDPHSIIKENEIIIGNYRMQRDSASHQWTLTQVSQITSAEAWAKIFQFRWKGRLNIATRLGTDFNNVLRYDYASDYIVFILCMAMALTPTGM